MHYLFIFFEISKDKIMIISYDISAAQNGRTYGFRVFLVGKQDDEWDNKIIQEIEKIRTL